MAHRRKDLQTLYKKNSKGDKILTCYIYILDNDEKPALQTTVTGSCSDAKVKVTEKYIKGNSRQTPFNRAINLATTLWEKKVRLGYHTTQKLATASATPLTAMLASEVSPRDILSLPQSEFPVYMSVKLNGLRGTYHAMVDKIMTRQLKTYNRLKGVSEALCELSKVMGCQYIDMELKSRHEAPINEQVSMVRSGDDRVVAYIFDVPTELSVTFRSRLTLMQQASKRFKSPYIEFIPYSVARTPQELLDFYLEAIDLGEEGIMMRPINSTYKWNNKTSRGKELVKIKPLLSDEFKIVGIGCEKRIIKGHSVELIDFLCETKDGEDTFKVTPASFGHESREAMYKAYRTGELTVDAMAPLSLEFREWTTKRIPFIITHCYLREDL